MGATEIIPNDFCAIFQADADFEVKSAVASYSWAGFGHFLGQKFGQNFCFFWVCGNKRETPICFVLRLKVRGKCAPGRNGGGFRSNADAFTSSYAF